MAVVAAGILSSWVGKQVFDDSMRKYLTEFWEQTQRSAAPVALLRRKLGEERWAEVADGVFNHLHETLGDGPVEDTYTMHLGVGTK